jgi:hypothetical protein
MDWETRFRQVSKRAKRPASFSGGDHSEFGSFLGIATEKTIADLRELMRVKDNDLAQIEASIQGKKLDPDLLKDWNNLKARYRAARDAAQFALDKGTGGFLGSWADEKFEHFTTAAQYYDAILKSLAQSYPDTVHVTKGDLQDVMNRLATASVSLKVPTAPAAPIVAPPIFSAKRDLPSASSLKTPLVIGAAVLGGVLLFSLSRR